MPLQNAMSRNRKAKRHLSNAEFGIGRILPILSARCHPAYVVWRTDRWWRTAREYVALSARVEQNLLREFSMDLLG